MQPAAGFHDIAQRPVDAESDQRARLEDLQVPDAAAQVSAQATFPRALFAADHRRSISCTACIMLGRYLRAATSGVIEDEKKIRFRLPSTGPAPRIGSAMALMPASDPPTEDA